MMGHISCLKFTRFFQVGVAQDKSTVMPEGVRGSSGGQIVKFSQSIYARIKKSLHCQ